MNSKKTTLTDTILTPDNYKKTNTPTTKESDLSTLLNNTPEKKDTNLPILQDPEFLELKSTFNEKDEFKEYLEKLVNNYGLDKKKLDELYERIVEKNVKNLMKKIEESGYTPEKINNLLGKELTEEIEKITSKMEAIKNGSIEIEKKIKELGVSKIEKKSQGFLNIIKGIFKIGEKEIRKTYNMLIDKTKNKLNELRELKPDVTKLIEKINNSEKELINSAKEFQKQKIAFSYLLIAYKILSKKQSNTTDTFLKALSEKESLILRNKITQLENQKVKADILSVKSIELSKEAYLIAESLKAQYNDTLQSLVSNLFYLTNQQIIKDGVDFGNHLQKINEISIKNTFESMRMFNNELTELLGSSNNTTQILAEEIKGLTENVEKNRKRRDEIEEKSKILSNKLHNAAEEYKKTVYNSINNTNK